MEAQPNKEIDMKVLMPSFTMAKLTVCGVLVFESWVLCKSFDYTVGRVLMAVCNHWTAGGLDHWTGLLD